MNHENFPGSPVSFIHEGDKLENQDVPDLKAAVIAAQLRIANARNKVASRDRLTDWAIARVARAFEEGDSESFVIALEVYELAGVERNYYGRETQRVRAELFRLRPEIVIGHYALKAAGLEEPTTYPY